MFFMISPQKQALSSLGGGNAIGMKAISETA